MAQQPVGTFFDALTDDYTATIERCFPRYREMLWAVLEYLPTGREFRSILELGSGTGNLSVLLQVAFPQARLRVVDISAESLAVCQSRLGNAAPGRTSAGQNGEVICEQQDFRRLEYPPASFDLVVSSIAIHHLPADGKQQLFAGIHEWLTDDGILCYADQCAGVTRDIHTTHMTHWEQISREAGSTPAEWEMWMQHQAEHDHHDTLANQFAWLTTAGFTTLDCPWRYLLWSVIQARKST